MVQTTWHAVSTWAFTVTTNASAPIVSPTGDIFIQIMLPVAASVIGAVLGVIIKSWLEGKIQKWRDGKSKTPVVIKFR